MDHAATRLGAFVLLLAAVFAAAVGTGAALDPSVEEPAPHDEEMSAAHAADSAALPGLAVAQDGYRLVPLRTSLESPAAAPYRFRIADADGETVRDFDVEHDRRMHLIVVRRDFAGFQHLHPRRLADGTWAVELDPGAPGTYRVFADFATGGESLTLATDLFVGGPFRPRPLPEPAASAPAGDGFEVAIESATPAPGGTTPVSFTVTRRGRPVNSVQPYLGADGHLVALRDHDQAFLHTHPQGEPGGSGPISFEVEYPSAGRYRLFLQFKHGGAVRTAAFTQEVGHDDL